MNIDLKSCINQLFTHIEYRIQSIFNFQFSILDFWFSILNFCLFFLFPQAEQRKCEFNREWCRKIRSRDNDVVWRHFATYSYKKIITKNWKLKIEYRGIIQFLLHQIEMKNWKLNIEVIFNFCFYRCIENLILNLGHLRSPKPFTTETFNKKKIGNFYKSVPQKKIISKNSLNKMLAYNSRKSQ